MCIRLHLSKRTIKITKIGVIEEGAFNDCKQLTEVELPTYLFDTIEGYVFQDCRRLVRHIAIPLKDNLLGNYVFEGCDDLSQVDLVGGIHKTISSLLLDSWKNEMNNEIDHINWDLPNVYHHQKTTVIRQWMERVINRFDHYKMEHYILLKHSMTLIELALWKAKLDEEFGESLNKEDNESNKAKKVKIDMKAARQEQRITSGANVVIKNVLPFLKLKN